MNILLTEIIETNVWVLTLYLTLPELSRVFDVSEHGVLRATPRPPSLYLTLPELSRVFDVSEHGVLRATPRPPSLYLTLPELSRVFDVSEHGVLRATPCPPSRSWRQHGDSAELFC